MMMTSSRKDHRSDQLLKWAFAVGAITDAAALGPMLVPDLARWMWGITDVSATYRYAMGYGAALMLGWTLLLVWAYRSPLERRVVAPLTNVVIVGLVSAEVLAVLSGAVTPDRMAPTWFLQAVLLILFATAFHTAPARSGVAVG